jgi:hypothetical protein
LGGFRAGSGSDFFLHAGYLLLYWMTMNEQPPPPVRSENAEG